MNTNDIVQLKQRLVKLQEEVDSLEKQAGTAVYNLIYGLTPLKTDKVYIEFTKPWDEKEGRKRMSCGTIRFLTDDPDQIAKGRTTDFGSDFHLDVFEFGIKINKGTCGSYTREDKYQVGRDLLLAKLWEHEQDFVNILNLYFTDVFFEMKEVSHQIYCIEADLRRAEEERNRNAALLELKQANYLFSYSKLKDYELDEDFNRTGRVRWQHHYYEIMMIDKITDKSVLVHEKDYRWCKHRLDIKDVLNQLINKTKYCSPECPEDYYDPYQEESK